MKRRTFIQAALSVLAIPVAGKVVVREKRTMTTAEVPKIIQKIAKRHQEEEDSIRLYGAARFGKSWAAEKELRKIIAEGKMSAIFCTRNSTITVRPNHLSNS
jgi:hypothetical protein